MIRDLQRAAAAWQEWVGENGDALAPFSATAVPIAPAIVALKLRPGSPPTPITKRQARLLANQLVEASK